MFISQPIYLHETIHLKIIVLSGNIKDPGSCVKDPGWWAHTCLVSMTMSPTHCDVIVAPDNVTYPL